MKLASLKTGGRDGSLIVVDRGLQNYVSAGDIAPTLQAAIDWIRYCGPDRWPLWVLPGAATRSASGR